MKSKNFKKITILGILFIATLSVLLNIFLYKQMRKYYTLLYAHELDPIGLSYFQDESIQHPAGKRIVVFFGDSRAAQWIAPSMDEFSFINRGIGNQTSAQVLLRFEEHVLPFQPEIIILQVCINDLKTIPLFPERKRGIIDNCKTNIGRITKKSLDLGATVILTTVFPTSGDVPLERRLVWSNDIYQAINEVNQFILSYHHKGVTIFDTTSILSNSAGHTRPEYVHDLLHLNADGYQTLNNELMLIMKRLK